MGSDQVVSPYHIVLLIATSTAEYLMSCKKSLFGSLKLTIRLTNF